MANDECQNHRIGLVIGDTRAAAMAAWNERNNKGETR